MTLKAGDHVVAESEQVGRPGRSGVIQEVLRPEPRPRYRILWDDEHESIYAPDAGALRAVDTEET